MKNRKYQKYSDRQIIFILIGNIIVWSAIGYVLFEIFSSL